MKEEVEKEEQKEQEPKEDLAAEKAESKTWIDDISIYLKIRQYLIFFCFYGSAKFSTII